MKDFKTTKEIDVSEKIIDQVVGQEKAVETIKKAAQQRRHVFLIGEPGTGKSMLGVALSELLPKEELKDIVAFPNQNDENQPLIRVMPAGKARELVQRAKMETANMFKGQNIILLILLILFLFIAPWWAFYHYGDPGNVIQPFLGSTEEPINGNPLLGGLMFFTFTIAGLLFFASYIFIMNLGKRMAGAQKPQTPKVIVDNYNKKKAPFNDATGAHAGALLGDVLHDPFQSGGLGTPAQERVVAGMMHKSHLGVLFIDEIATLHSHTQQELLTALQEGKYPITGQSERSAGAMVRTEPVPCNFVLVAAGNYDSIQNMHPALRSRIRGYGYEIYMQDSMPDTPEHQEKISIFVAQEVKKDKKIPHFTKEAVEAIIEEARRMANRKGHLTLRFRELGGIIRAAGDLAKEEKAKLVEKKHVADAKKVARSLEKQIADTYIERKKEYEVIVTSGSQIGRVNGLAVMGAQQSASGIILPIEAEVTKGGKSEEIIATGKLGDIAKEAVKNVSAIIKRYFGEDIKNYDIHVQFLQTYEGVEGDSASIAVAVAIISALKDIPIKQDYAITGSLSVRGTVLPVGGVSSKVEAAIETGLKTVIVPKSNMQDIVIAKEKLDKIQIIPVQHISDVLKEVYDWKNKKQLLNKLLKA
ncbi:MAG: ATP-dependent protease LonB [Candidatus Woesearchaeota archaeon]